MIKTAIPWLAVLFKLLAATGSGVLAFAGISELVGSGDARELRPQAALRAAIVALALVVCGGVLYILRLGSPAQAMAIVRNVSSGSPASWEFLIYLLLLVCSVVCLVRVRREGSLGGVLSVVCIVLALAMGFITGYSHMAMTGTPAWHTPAIPAGFMASALLLGGFISVSLAGQSSSEASGEDRESPEEGQEGQASPGEDRAKRIAWILVALALITAVSAVLFGIPASFGPETLLYWIAVPVIGGVASAFAAVLAARTRAPWWAYVGVLCSLVGALVFRVSLWLVGSTIPTLLRG
ncbi:MAG: dimethyl sulfoxide reductase anchor subunit [Coriobacteriales bacterium]|nr:dimethyl sulfoxide reductase anchor subunit [Coriobacteriales bacterium]